MSSLVVLLAPPGPVVAVRETLRDLSAVGLIDPFVWVDASSVNAGQISALSVEAGRMAGTSLQQLSTGTRFTRVRIVSLVPVVAGATATDAAHEQQVAQLLENSTGGATLTRIRLIITRVGDPTTSSDIARVGWHNILVAPEEGTGPGRGHALLQATRDGIDVGRHAAMAVAGLAGLWSGVAESPLDGNDLAPGESVRVARSYFRRLQSESLETELRARVTATSESLPLPVDGSSSTVYVEDSALATSTMSKALWTRHQDILKGPRERRQASAIKPIGVWAAIKMFFSFLWASVRNAPQQWVRGIVVSVSSRVAGAVHGAVFGSSASAYAVVVGGVTSSGLPASWLDLADAADAIDEVLDAGGEPREHHALSDHSALWADYSAGALTLADAGERVQGMAPVQIGTQRAVLRTVDLCVPGPESRFSQIPGHIAAQIEIASVDAFDVLAINNLHARLMQLQREAAIGLEVGSTLQALQTWNNTHKNSYAARVGSVLGESVVRTGEEIKTLLTELRAAAASEDLPAAMLAKQKKLGRVLQILSAVAIAVGVAIGVVFGLGLISSTLAIILAVGATVAWAASAAISFFRGQRVLFGMLNARKELIAGAELNKRNLRQAVRDLRRQTDAYAQFLAWSKVLSSVLAEPLGRTTAVAEDGARLSGGFPLSVKLGSAAVDPDALASAVITLRREIFRTGWLTDPWEALIASASTMIGPEAYELQNDPTAIYRQAGSGDTSLLLTWVNRVEAQGVGTAVADRLWSSVQAQLDGDKRSVAAALLGSITELGHSGSRQISYAEFMASVDDPHGAGSLGEFDAVVFTPEARASAQRAVDQVFGRQSSIGLSRIAVLTQLSQGSPPYVFHAYGAPARPVDDVPRADFDPGFVF